MYTVSSEIFKGLWYYEAVVPSAQSTNEIEPSAIRKLQSIECRKRSIRKIKYRGGNETREDGLSVA